MDMPGLHGDDVNEAHPNQDVDYIVPEDVVLQAVIDAFDKTGRESFADVLRVVKRAYRIETSDLVGGDNMIGARVTFVDRDGEPHRALVLEPNVGNIFDDEAYDPRKGEMVDPSDYPMGTVQLVRGDGWEFGEDFDGLFDRVESDSPGRGLKAETSVPPARKPDAGYCYFAGWGYHDEKKAGDD